MVHLPFNMIIIEKKKTHLFKDIETNFPRILKYPYDLISFVFCFKSVSCVFKNYYNGPFSKKNVIVEKFYCLNVS